MSPKNVLITGGSGTIGRELLNLLEKDKRYKTTVLLRNTGKNKRFANRFKHIQFYFGDITDKETFELLKGNFDYAIHLAALIPPIADKYPLKTKKVNVVGTENVCWFLKQHSPNCFLLYSSSVAIYGDRLENPDIKTTDTLGEHPYDVYAQTKVEAEQIIKSSGLPYSIFRVSAVMGASNHKMSPLMFHMPLKTSIEIITPFDAAHSFYLALEKSQKLKNQIFNLGGGAQCRIKYKDLLALNFKLFGLGKLDYPTHCFAEKNFHCGNYMDGDDLEAILHFRTQDLQAYQEIVKNSISSTQRFFTRIFAPLIRFFIWKQSEPRKAYLTKNKNQIHRFFG